MEQATQSFWVRSAGGFPQDAWFDLEKIQNQTLTFAKNSAEFKGKILYWKQAGMFAWELVGTPWTLMSIQFYDCPSAEKLAGLFPTVQPIPLLIITDGEGN